MTQNIVKKLELNDKEKREFFFEGNDDYELYEEGKWEDEGKYQYGSNIFKDKEDKYWELGASKSGSYFSDFEYEINNELAQVVKEEVVVKRWANVKSDVNL